MKFEQPPQNLPTKESEEIVIDSQEKSKEKEFGQTLEEETFLNSLDISPDRRRMLRGSLERMKNSEIPWIYCMQELKSFPREVLTSEYIKTVAKESFYKRIIAFDTSYNLGNWVETMETFGIEKDFFLQNDFDEYRKGQWLERIESGNKIDDPDRFKRDWTGSISGSSVLINKGLGSK